MIAGYPRWLALRAHFWSRPPRSGPCEPAITAIIPVHNGIRFLSAKLESILSSDYPPDKLDILILSDGSDDGTDDLAAEFTSQFPDTERASLILGESKDGSNIDVRDIENLKRIADSIPKNRFETFIVL